MKAIASNGIEINTGDPVLIRDTNNENWRYTYFSHKINENDWSYVSSCTSSIQCIPYKGNEHLVGTNKDYKSYKDKFKFRFGAKVRAICKNKNIVEGILIRHDLTDNDFPYCIAINKEDYYQKGDIEWVESIEYIE